MAKNNEISYKSIRKSIGHLKRGVLSQFGFSLKFITPKFEDKMFYSKKKLLKLLSNLEKENIQKMILSFDLSIIPRYPII